MRQDFSKHTKRTIAARAGNQCSYINCGIRTSGPDPVVGASINAGVAAHIYSASPGGPRGQGGLTIKELMHHQNGIWLCSAHASLIDANKGVGHPAEKLFSYKRLHEHRVQKELLGVCSSIGWIDEFELIQSPLFCDGAKVRLGKLNLLFGDSLGKTTFGRFLGGIFDQRLLGYWHKPGEFDLEFHVRYHNPDPLSIRFLVNEEYSARYEINGVFSSRNTVNCHVIMVPEFQERDIFRNLPNDRAFIANLLMLPEWEVAELIKYVNSFQHSNFCNYRFEGHEEQSGLALYLKIPKKKFVERTFSLLSGTEQKLVLIDFATAAARRTSLIAPTLLVLDCNLLSGVKYFEKLEEQLLAPENHFQTIMTMRLDGIDLTDVQWRGWEVIRLYRESNTLTQFSQDPKMKFEHKQWMIPKRKRASSL